MKPDSALRQPPERASRQRGGIRRALLRALGAIILIVGLYGLIGFYGGPWLVDRWLEQYRSGAQSRTALRESVRFNPFTLAAEIGGLELRDDDAGRAFAVERLAVDFSPRSLLEARPIVSAIVIERPEASLASVADLAALVRQVREAALSRARIERLELTGGAIASGPDAARSLELDRLDLSLTGLDGRSDEPAPFRVDATMASQAGIAIEGSLDTSLERASGQIRLDGIALDAVAARDAGAIGSADPRGRLDLAADFKATSLLTGPSLELANASLELSEVSLKPAAGLTATADRATAEGALSVTMIGDGIETAGRLELDELQLSIRDTRVAPPPEFELDAAAVLVTIEPGNGELTLTLGGRLRGAGDVAVTIRPLTGTTAGRRVTIEAGSLPATLLSAYASDTVGRGLIAGETDLGLQYSLNGDRVDGSLQIVARELEFSGQSPAQDPGAASLELAAALLENSDRVIEISLPFASNTGPARDAVGAALAARLATVTATPFATLAPIMEGAGNTAGAVPFLPGDAALNDTALATIGQLAAVLNARPRLGMRVHGAYDPAADRDALARQQIELHVQLATAGPDAQARPTPVDFGSARAQDVLDEFAGERLPAERVTELGERFECEGALAPICRRAYYEQIFDALVANEEISPTALSRLGRFRALSIVDALRQQGIPDERIEIVPGGTAAETAFGIGLPVDLIAAETDNEASLQPPE